MTVVSSTAISSKVTHAQIRPRRKPASVFARTRAFFILVWQAFAEGRKLARAAHRRYPFAEW
jgi:hypothetical protein